MRENFAACLAETWKHEGGYSDHPSDPGGATRYGITIATLRDWRGRPVTKADVQTLTRDEAALIYRAWYWDKCKCDALPSGVDAVVFDAAVNSGPARSVRWLQAAVGVTADGKIGPQTLAAATAANPRRVINHALDARLQFMRGLKTWSQFGKGWSRRVAEVRAFALGLTEAPAPLPKPAILPRPVDPRPASPRAGETPAWINYAIAVCALVIAIYLATKG